MRTVSIVNDGREIGQVVWDGNKVVMSGAAQAVLNSGVRVVDEELAELEPASEAYVERLPLCLAGTRVWAEPLDAREAARREILRYVESQHPRDPGGKDGGRWIKKGTTAAGDEPQEGEIPITKGETAKRLLGDHPDTQSLYVGAEGRYLPARLELHAEIINHFLEKGVVQDEPATLFITGGTASGKSTMLDSGELDDDFDDFGSAVLINPDEIKEMLPEYKEMIKGGDQYAAWGTHEESSDIAKKLLAVTNERKYHAIVDGTGDSGPGKFEGKVAAAEAAGRRAKVIYVDVPTDLAVTRALKRAKETGRMVPVSEIRKIHREVAARHVEYADKIDDWEVWVTDKGTPRMVAERENDEVKIYDQKRYDQTLAKGKGG
jgi:predicted ABC-type ATPase